MTEATRAAVVPAAVSAHFRRRIPYDFARFHGLVSQGNREGHEHLIISETTSTSAVFNVGVRLGAPVTVEHGDPEDIARTLDEVYERQEEEPLDDEEKAEESIESLLQKADQDLLTTQGKSRIVQLVDSLLFEALSCKASDLHLQPLEDKALVRLRVDGALKTARELPPAVAAAAVSRIKVMGGMDIAERRVAQDGRTTVRLGTRAVDLRISTFPTSFGERSVLRLLDTAHQVFDLEALGMPADVIESFEASARRSHGLILVTGPTGSGKTTTLYSTLRRIATADLNIMTIEDPIEYDLTTVGLAVSQSQVNTRKGVTFATGLRHILRQDPDVILVGEIRDAETARMAIQSSLTGHLVFATLHTNDAPSAITRLIDLGIEPFLVSASLIAVLAQRLVRTIHQPCGGQGCEECLDSGLLGRMGLYELLTVEEEVRSLIARDADLAQIREAASRHGMRSLRAQGETLVEAGRVHLLEVERVAHSES